MPSPLISVIIPTFKRSDFLPGAVSSALQHHGEDVEVIVIPNGLDRSWKESLAPWCRDNRVRVYPVEIAQGNIARNHGMMKARGKYLRFLDDDDYLLPAASEQIYDLEKSGSDISVGCISVITENNRTTTTRKPIRGTNLVESILARGHLTLLHAYLYRRESISEFRWDPKVSLAQDKLWLYELCRAREWKLVQSERVVGIWRQHHGARVSGKKRLKTQSEVWAAMLWDTICQLNAQGRLNQSRQVIACEHLWRLTFDTYYLHPQYWDQIIDNVLRLSPGSRPDLPLWRYRTIQRMNPRTILRAARPLMHVSRWARIALLRLGLYHPMIRP